MSINPIKKIIAATAGILLLNSAAFAASLPYSESYESTPVDELPASHAVITGSASVQNASQRDGSIGHVLYVNEGSKVLVDVGSPVDVSASVDVSDGFQSGYLGIRMSADGMNGYVALYDTAGAYIKLYKVVGGLRTQLGETLLRIGSNPWNRFVLEARGPAIRVAVEGAGAMVSGEIRAFDSDFASGQLVLGKDPGRGGDVARFDNLSVKAPEALVSASESGANFSSGFDSAELALRNGIVVHPNIDLLSGGTNFIAFPQKDGSLGNVLTAAQGTILRLNTPELSDVSASVDIHDDFQSGLLGIRMSSDGLSGYVLQYDPMGGAIRLYRLDGGIKTLLAVAPARADSADSWNRIILEARGSHLRGAVMKGGMIVSGEIRTVDSTHASGEIILGKDAGRGFNPVWFDNLRVVSPPPSLAEALPASLPVSITLADSELSFRNEIILHPNLDLISGGYAIANTEQLSGDSGNILFVESGASVKLASAPLGNFRMGVDVSDVYQSLNVGFRMSLDGQNGYLVMYDSYGSILDLYSVSSGARNLLSRAALPPAAPSWNRLSVEADGSSLQVKLYDRLGALRGSISVTDGAHEAGFVVLSKDAGRGGDVARFDNLEVGSIITDRDGDGILDDHDDCPDVKGLSGYNGCPFADKTKVSVHIVDQAKSGACGANANGKPKPACTENLVGAVVRVFDRESADFISAYGSRPKKDLLKAIYNGGIGLVGECATDVEGTCIIGEDHPGAFLVIAKYPESGTDAYVGKFKNFKALGAGRDCDGGVGDDCDDEDSPDASGKAKKTLISKHLRFQKIIQKDGSVKVFGTGLGGDSVRLTRLSGFWVFIGNLFGLLTSK
jgi:hypothetical protein